MCTKCLLSFQVRRPQHTAARRACRLQRSSATSKHHPRLPQRPWRFHQAVSRQNTSPLNKPNASLKQNDDCHVFCSRAGVLSSCASLSSTARTFDEWWRSCSSSSRRANPTSRPTAPQTLSTLPTSECPPSLSLPSSFTSQLDWTMVYLYFAGIHPTNAGTSTPSWKFWRW